MIISKSAGIKLFFILILIPFNYSFNNETNSHTENGNYRIAITVDDLPFTSLNGKNNERVVFIINELIENLRKFNAPATGFVNENKLYIDGKPDQTRIKVLEK